MTPKPVRLTVAARSDVNAIIRHYRTEAGETVAVAFVDALQRAVASIGATPAAGSPRYAREAGIPELRHRSLRHFPHLVFYLERQTFVEVIRVLHGKRDSRRPSAAEGIEYIRNPLPAAHALRAATGWQRKPVGSPSTAASHTTRTAPG